MIPNMSHSSNLTTSPYILELREQFPILQRKNHLSKPLIYVDNAATTQKPQTVIDSLVHYYTQQNANIHRGVHLLATEATAGYEQARSKVKQFLNAQSEREIVLTSGTTQSINIVAQSFLNSRLQAGDEVLITAMEHHANLIPWQVSCQKKGAQLKIIPISSQGEIDLAAYTQLLSPRTKMVSIVHISNSLGIINPVKEMISLAHHKGIPVLIDGAQSAAHYEIDVQELDCDFFTFSGHKIYGPTGIGVLYGKEKYLAEMTPFQFGGDMIREVTYKHTTYADYPQRFEAGTPHIAGAIGLDAALTFLSELDHQHIRNHIDQLRIRTEHLLKEIPNLCIYGASFNKSGIISFSLEEVHPHDMATVLNEEGVAIRAGHHCTQPLMELLNVPQGTARISFALYNTQEEIPAILRGVRTARQIFV